MALPKISIFLSYYNDADFLKTAIDAILNQSFCDFELILLNHATTDNCREIARSYADERIVHIDKDFNYGAGCRDAKASPKSQISNSFRQSICQPASHIASQFFCRLYLLYANAFSLAYYRGVIT